MSLVGKFLPFEIGFPGRVLRLRLARWKEKMRGR